MSNFTVFPAAAFTFVAWLRVPSDSPEWWTAGSHALFAFGTPTEVDTFTVVVHASTGALTIRINGIALTTGASVLADNDWHVLVVAWGAAEAAAQVYVDAAFLYENSTSGALLPSGAGCVAVGRRGSGSCTASGFSSYSGNGWAGAVGQVCGGCGRAWDRGRTKGGRYSAGRWPGPFKLLSGFHIWLSSGIVTASLAFSTHCCLCL